jgi:hypothetical protein
MKRITFCLLSLIAATAAHADPEQACGDAMVDALAKAAKVTADVVAQACKPLPDDPRTTIVVAAFGNADEEDGTKQQVVGLVDTASSRVLAMGRDTIEEDAVTHVGESAYVIDTARYRLSPEVRAFGIVFHSDARGPSCPDAYASGELTLWVRDGKALRPVLGTNLDGWVSVKGTACGAGHGEAVSEDAHITVAVEKTATHGYADISLTAHITSSHRGADDAWQDGPKRTGKTLLKYDGKSYGTDMFRNFWYPATSE